MKKEFDPKSFGSISKLLVLTVPWTSDLLILPPHTTHRALVNIFWVKERIIRSPTYLQCLRKISHVKIRTNVLV